MDVYLVQFYVVECDHYLAFARYAPWAVKIFDR